MSRNQEIVSLLSSSEDENDSNNLFGSDIENDSDDREDSKDGRGDCCECPNCRPILPSNRQSLSNSIIGNVNANFFHRARPSSNTVIDLLSDSDGEPSIFRPINNTVSHRRSTDQRSTLTSRTVLRMAQETAEIERNVIANTTKTTATIPTATTPKRPRSTEATGKIQKPKVKEEFPAKKFGQANNDEVTEVLGLNDEMEIEQSKSSNDICDVDDDVITFVGGNLQGLGDMPHQRESCSKYQFVRIGLVGDIKKNSSFCNFCYCYICEIPASTCLEWNNHCQATYKLESYKRENESRKAKLFVLMNSSFRASFWFKYSYIFSAVNNPSYSSSAEKMTFLWKCFDEVNELFLVIFKKFYDIDSKIKEGNDFIDWNSTLLQSMVLAIQILKLSFGISDKSTTFKGINLKYIVNETSVNFFRLFIHSLCNIEIRKACIDELIKIRHSSNDNHLSNLVVSISTYNDIALPWLQSNKTPPSYLLNLSTDNVKIFIEAIIMNGGKDNSVQHFLTNYKFLVPYFCICFLKRNIYGEGMILLSAKITSLLKSSIENLKEQSKAEYVDRNESYSNLSGFKSISKLIFLLECCNESECTYFNLIKSIINEICLIIFEFDVYKKYQQINVDNNKMFPGDSIHLNLTKTVELYQKYKKESANSILYAVELLETSMVMDTSQEQENQIDMVINCQISQINIANIAMISIIKILTKICANNNFAFLDSRVIAEVIKPLKENYKVILTHTLICLASTSISAPSSQTSITSSQSSSSSSQSKAVVTLPGRTSEQILMMQLSLQIGSTMCTTYSSNYSYSSGNLLHLYLSALPQFILGSWFLLPRSFMGCYPNISLLGNFMGICDLTYNCLDYLNIPECINVVYNTIKNPFKFDIFPSYSKKLLGKDEINQIAYESQSYCIKVIWKSFIFLVHKTKLIQDPKSKKNNNSSHNDDILVLFNFFHSKFPEILSKLFTMDSNKVTAMTLTEFEGKFSKIPDIEDHNAPFIILFKLKEILKLAAEIIKNENTNMNNFDEDDFWIRTISEFKAFINNRYIKDANLHNIKDFWCYIFGLVMRQTIEINKTKNKKPGSAISFAMLSDWDYVYTLLGTSKFIYPTSNINGKIEAKNFVTSLLKLNDTSFESGEDILSLSILMKALCENTSVKAIVLPIVHQIASLETLSIFDAFLKYDEFTAFCYFALLTLSPVLISKFISKPLNITNSVFFEKEYDNLRKNIIPSVNRIDKGVINSDGLITNSNILVSLALLGHFNMVKSKLMQDYKVENLSIDEEKQGEFFKVLTMIFSKFIKNIDFNDAIVNLLDPWISLWYQIDRVNARAIIEDSCDWINLLSIIDDSEDYSLSYRLYIKELMVYHCTTESSVNDFFGLLSISELEQFRIDYSTDKIKNWINFAFKRNHIDICAYLDIICKHFASDDLIELLSNECLDELYDENVKKDHRYNKLDIINTCISLAYSYESHRKVLYCWLSKIILSLPCVNMNIREQIRKMLQQEIDIKKAVATYDESLIKEYTNIIGNQINQKTYSQDFYNISAEPIDENENLNSHYNENNKEVIEDVLLNNIFPYDFSLVLLQLIANPSLELIRQIKKYRLFTIYKNNVYKMIVESEKLESCTNILIVEEEFSILFEVIISHIRFISNIILKGEKSNKNIEVRSLMQLLEIFHQQITKEILLGGTKLDCADNVSMWIQLFINPKSFLYEVMFLLRESYCIFSSIKSFIDNINLNDQYTSRFNSLFVYENVNLKSVTGKLDEISSKIIVLSNYDELIRCIFSSLRTETFTATAMQEIVDKYKVIQSTLTDTLISLNISFPLINLFQVIYSTINSYSKFELSSNLRVDVISEVIKICNNNYILKEFCDNIALENFLRSVIYGPVSVVNPVNDTVYNIFTDVINLQDHNFWIKLTNSILTSNSSMASNIIEDSIMSYICNNFILDTMLEVEDEHARNSIEQSLVPLNHPWIVDLLQAMSQSNPSFSHLNDLLKLNDKFDFNIFQDGLIAANNRTFHNRRIWEHIVLCQVILRNMNRNRLESSLRIIDDINEILKLLSMDFSLFDYVLEKNKDTLLITSSSISQYYLTLLANIIQNNDKNNGNKLYKEFAERKIDFTVNKRDYDVYKLLRYPVIQDKYLFIKSDSIHPLWSLSSDYISNIINHWKYIINLIYETIDFDKIEELLKSFTQKILIIGNEFVSHLITKGVVVVKSLKEKFATFCEFLKDCLNYNYSLNHLSKNYPYSVLNLTLETWIIFRRTAHFLLKSKKAVLNCVQ